MQRIITLAVIILTQVSFFMADPGVTKHALIIAIGDYPEVSGWKDISSANDVELIQSALSKQGFTDFIILRDSQADKESIIKAFEDLKNKVRKNDVVVVHFSSHGQQILDADRDEIDRLDEAIVAYGAPMKYDKGYEGENHLLDDELGTLLDGIRTKLGSMGDLLVLLDACHSGTGTRGEGVVRGGAPPMVPDGFVPKPDSKQLGIFEESKVNTRGDAPEMASLVVISAARAEELNYEYNGFGSLSVAFSKSLDGLAEGYSYRSLFSKIVKEMSVIARNQTPSIEGDVDRQLFGGRVVSQQAYYRLRSLSRDFIQIEGGRITGLNEGTKVSIYPAGTVSTKGQSPVATGTIGYAEDFRASANLDKKLEGTLLDYWVFVEERTFGDVRIKVSTTHIQDRALRKELNTMIEEYPLTLLSDTGEFEIIQLGAVLQLIEVRNGDLIHDNLKSDNNYKSFKDAVSTYAQGKFLKSLELANHEFNIEIELIPIRLVDGKVDTLEKNSHRGPGGMLEFRQGDQALIKITNHGSSDVYFNIIDIEPSGKVNAVMPDPMKNEDPANFRIRAGSSFIPRKVLTFYPPYGTETYKIFASYDPIDLSPILRTRGTGNSRGLTNPLEVLFQESYTLSRGTVTASLPTNSNACTFAYTFRIIN